MDHALRKRGTRRTSVESILRSLLCGILVGAIGAIVLEARKTPARPAELRPTVRAALLVTPEGDGNCRKLTYSNDTGKVIGAEIVSCGSIKGTERSGLPPVLREYQNSLGTR